MKEKIKEDLTDAQYYVIMADIDGEDKYFNGFGRCGLWVDNCETCGWATEDLVAARSMKKIIKRDLGKKSKIIKIHFLEVE